MLKRIKKITSEFQAFSEKAVPKRPARRRKIVFEEMERRVLLSADCIIPPQDLLEAADLLPDLIPALVECDGQVAESQLLAADNLEIEEAPVPADVGDGGLEPVDKAAAPSADAATEAEASAKAAAGQTEEADDSAPKDTMAEATEEDETAASDLQNTAESQQTTVDARTDAAEDDGGATSDPQDSAESQQTTALESSPQSAYAAYMVSQEAAREIIFIDPSVPDYRSLLEEITHRNSTVEDGAQSYLAASGPAVVIEASPSEAGQDSPSLSVLAFDLDPASADTATIPQGGAEAGRGSYFEVVILDSARDGIEQITEALEEYQGISAVHIVSHGAVGMLRLGNSLIDREKLKQKVVQLNTWDKALKPGGDILLYGCNVAQGETGVEFIENLSKATGADVAASTDDTGSKDLGGDWELEFSTGIIEATPFFGAAFPVDYRFLLDTIMVDGTAVNDTITLSANQVQIGAAVPRTFDVGDDLVVNGLGGDDDFMVSAFPDASSLSIDGGEDTDTLDFSGVSSPLTFTFSPTTVTVSDNAATPNSLNATNVENLVGGTGNDRLDFSGNEDHLVFVIRKNGTVTITDGDYTINLDGTVTVSGGTGSLDASQIENIIGGDGSNTFVFEDGATLPGTITGGADATNTLNYSAYTTDVGVDLSAGAAQGTAGVTNIQNIVGGSGDDTLIGDENPNTIDGGTGSDTLAGGGGTDSLFVTDLEETSGTGVEGGGENDILDFSDENSDLTFTFASLTDLTISDNVAVPNTVSAESVETVFAGAGKDTLDFSSISSDLTFVIHSYGGVTVTDGGYTVNADGTVSVSGGTGTVTVMDVENILGGQGNNTYVFEDRAYLFGTIDGGSGGTNALDYSAFTKGVRVDLQSGAATGTSGISNIHKVTGGAGDDTIQGSAGDDAIDGGAGTDTIDYSGAAGGVTVDLRVSTAQDTGNAGTDTLSNFENIIGSPFADTLTGDDNPNTLDGGGGNDILSGGAGNDTYAFGQDWGTDTIIESPGGGTDTLDLSRVSADLAFTIKANGIISVLSGADSINSAANMENLVGGDGSNVFAFENGASIDGTIDGGKGPSNTLNYALYTSGVAVDLGAGNAQGTLGISNIRNITGGSGNDVLTGDANDNVLDGGPGHDVIDGGEGIDTVDYSKAPAGVNVNLSTQGATGGAGTDTLQDIENIIGSPFNDILTGDANDNVLDGGPGNDVIDGGEGIDTVDYSKAPAGVNVNLSTQGATGGAGTDSLQNIENIVGSAFADTLTGDANANVLDGGPGNDTLIGGAGDDTYRMSGHWGTEAITELAGGGTDTLVVVGNPDNDVFSVGSNLVERKDPATLTVTDSVSYGNTIESLSIDAGEGQADQILFAQTLISDGAVSFSAEDINFSQDIYAAAGITATAEDSITVAAGVTLSTRQVSGVDHENGISTGNSGTIDFNAPNIQILGGAKLLAQVQEGSTFTPGEITLKAEAGSDLLGDFLRVEDISSRITLSGATIKGGTVTIEAKADTNTEFGDIEDAGDAASFILEAIGQFMVMGGWSVSKALAEVDIQSGTVIEAVDAVIHADAKTQAKIMTLYTGLGVSYGESDPKARVYVQDGAEITTTGDLDITTKADSTMSISAYALTLGPERGKKWDLTAAVSKADIESTAQVFSGAMIQVGGDLSVQAETVKNHSTSALGGAYAQGNLGIGVAVSLCTTNANAFVDGTVIVDGNVRIAASSDIPKNDISASAVSGSGVVAGLMLKIPNAAADQWRKWTDQRLPRPESKSKVAMSAALAYADDTNNATAKIGDNASLTSIHGSILITSFISDVPEISANATVDSTGMASDHAKKNALATAIVVGNFNNHADAHIGSNATVIAEDFIVVNSDASVPYEANWGEMDGPGDIPDYLNSNMGIQNGFFTSWARSAATVDDIGIAGSINVVNFNNTSEAFIAENATVLQNTLQFDPSEIVMDSDGKGKIRLGPGHDLASGEQVVYNNGGGSDLGDLASGGTYYVLFDESDPEYIKLAAFPGGEALVLDTDGVTGTRHLLYKLTIEQQKECQANPSENAAIFDPTGMTGQSDQIIFGSEHHFYDGQEVVYSNGIEHILNPYAYLDRTNHAFFVGANHGFSDGDAVVYYVDTGVGLEGLTSGNTYYVVGATDDQIKLASTPGGPAIAIDHPSDSQYASLFTTVRLELKDLGALVNGETYYVKVVDASTITLASQAGGSAILLDFDQAKGVQQHLRSKYAVYVGANSLDTGEAVFYTNGGGSDIGGLQNNGVYYVIKSTDSYLKLARTRAEALSGIAVAINTSNTLGSSHTLSLVKGVTVQATSNIETVNFAGIYGLNPKRFFTSGADTAGVGISYLDISYVSSAKAGVKDSALVSASSLKVDASRTNHEISIAVSGGKAKKYGASGAISYLTVEKDGIDTLAHISDKAVIVTQDVPVFGSDASLWVNAHDYSKIFNVTGGVLLGANIGIGASIAINRIDRDTLAVVGNLEEDAAGNGSLFTPGNILVSAVNEGKIESYSVAATIALQSKSEPKPAAADAPAEGEEAAAPPADAPEETGKFGFHVSADVSLNTVRDTAQAYIRDAEIRQAEKVTLYAKNDSDIFAIAGSVSFSYSGNEGTSIGLAGAFSRNVVEDTTEAFIEDSTLSASGDLSLTTLTTGDIFSVTASGAGEVRDKAVAIAGSVSMNKIDNTTQSYMDGATVPQVNQVNLAATDESKINADGGGVALAVGKSKEGTGGSVAVGASLAWNDITNEICGFVQDSTISATGNVAIVAASTSTVDALTIGGALAVGSSGENPGFAIGGAGAASFNDIDNTIEAYIKGNGLVTSTGGGLSLTATDVSVIKADGGGVAIAVGASSQSAGAAISVGISLAVNHIANEVRSTIDGGTVTFAGDIELTALSASRIDALTIGGAVAVGASSEKTGFAFSGAGAGSGNTITNITEAAIKNSSTVTTTGLGAVKLTAIDSPTIIADAGGVGIAVGASKQGTGVAISVGVSIADNRIENKTKAYIDGSTVTSAGNIELTAVSAARIDALTIAGAVGVGASGQKVGFAAAGAGAGSYNDIKNTVEAYIKGAGSVTSTAGSLKLTAIDGLPLFDAPGLLATDYQNDGQLPAAWRAAFAAQGINLSNDITVTVRAEGREWLVKDNDKGETYLIKKEQDTYRVLKPTVITADGGGVAIGIGASGKDTGVALSIGVSQADNTINNTIRAYIDNSALPNPGATSVAAAGDIALSATSMAEIDALTIGGAIAVGASGGQSGGYAGAASGAAAYNRIENIIESFIKGVGSITSAAGDLNLTATDNAAIIANAVGGSIAVGASGSQAGGALSIGVSIAHNTIANKAQAYIDNTGLPAPDNTIVLNSGDVALTATSMDSIKALSIAATIAVGAGGKAGVALSGGGSESTNIILTKTNAYILGTDLVSTGDVTLDARNTSDINAKVITGSVSVGIGGKAGVAASVGASLARNLIGWDEDGNYKPTEVQAYVKNSSIAAQGDLTQNAVADETIDAVVVAGSIAFTAAETAGVGLSGSGADAENKISTQVKAFIDGDGPTGIVADNVTLTALDLSKIKADVGAGSLAASFAGEAAVSLSIGVALAENTIINQVEAYISNADNVTARDGSVALMALEGAAVDALSVAASLAVSFSKVGVALSGAGAEVENTIANSVKAYIADSSVTTNPSAFDYTQQQSPAQIVKGDRVRLDGGDIYEYVGATPLSGSVDLGAQTYADTTLWRPIGDIIVDALSVSSITATVGAVAAAVSGGKVAASGSIGVALLDNMVLNQIAAFIEDSTVSSADDILVRAKAMDTIDAVSFSGSVAIAVGIGGAGAGCGTEVTNTLMSGVSAYLQDTVATAVHDIDVKALSDSHIEKSQAIGVAVAASLGSASVAASLVDNHIGNTVQAFASSPYDYTVQDQPAEIKQGKRVRLDNREIYEYVGANPLAGPVDLGTQDYADTSRWERIIATSLEAGGNISILADVERARMSDVGATTVSVSAGAVGLSGGGIDIENTIANTVNAFVSGPINISADGDVSVIAREDAYIIGDATAVSISVSLGAGLGVALVENEVSSTVQAWVIGATVTSDNTLIHADSVANVAKTISCGVSGSALLGAQGNEATANIKTLVRAFAEDASLISAHDVVIQATATNTANTNAKGGAFGAIAVGAMVSDVNLGRGQDVYEVEAAVGAGSTVQARTLRIMASSTDDLLAESTAGGGGAVAAAGAQSEVTSDNATLARIGAGAQIQVDGLVMNSTHVQDIDASADSYAFAAAAGSGAGADNTITSKANVDIGAGAAVTARNIVITAKNQLTKDDYKDSSNLRSGSASLGNVTVMLSETSIGTDSSPFEAVVNIGVGARLTVDGDNQNPGAFKIEALNDIFAVDTVRIESVSGFGVSTGISRLDATTLAAVNVNGATLESKAGDVYLTAKTDSSINPSANLLVATALGGGAGAEATAYTNASNAVNVNNATIKGSDIYLYAGRDSTEVPNIITSHANTELTAISMYPNIAVPIPTADIQQNNTVSVLGASEIRALEDVNLVTDQGLGVRQTDGLALSLSLIPYGFPIPGYGDWSATNQVVMENQVSIEAGINNEAVMLIKPVTLLGEQNIDPARLEGTQAERLLTDAEKLEEGVSFVDINDADIVKVVDGANKGGVAGNRYAYKGDPAELVLSEEDYSDGTKWEDVTASTTDADVTYGSDYVTDVQYEYCALNVDEIGFNVFTGTVIQVAADDNGNPVAGGGVVGGLYLYMPQVDDPVPIVLDQENYGDTSKWEKIVIAYDLNTLPDTKVAIQKGQIVKTKEGELYRYLGESVGSPTFNLTETDYDNFEMWGQLGPNIYQSDMAVSFKASLKNKFYVVKPTRLNTPTMSLQNVGSLLLAQREQILDWIANHASNAEAVARYEIQLALVEETLAELGLMDSFVDPDTGQTAQVANEGLDVLFVDLPDIYAAPGSIFITADAVYRDSFLPLVDNQLVARAGAKINVFNETPFSMTVNDMVVRDTRRVAVVNGEYTVLTPGNVYFNNKGITNVQDPPDKRISITQDSISRNGADYDLDLEIPQGIGQDIYVIGDVINEVGDVTIINNEGSINVSGEIRAENVDIKAAQDFNLNTEAWFHNMDPRQYPGLDTYRKAAYNVAGKLTTKTYPDNPFLGAIDPNSSVLAQGRVGITAQYLNINGLIQSGVQTITLHVGSDFAPGATTSFLDDDGKPIAGISFGADRVPVDGYFDAQKQAIVVDEIVPQGGMIVLAGQILSTGNGMLKVAHGYAGVDIENESQYDLVLNRIDTTKKRDGKIIIVDTARLQKVEYLVDGEQIKETIYQGTPGGGDPTGSDGVISRIVYEEVDSHLHGLNETMLYQPREGVQYMWTEGQEKTRVLLTKYEKKSFNLFGTDSDWMVKDASYKWQRTNFRDEYPLLESELLGLEPDYDLSTLPGGTLVDLRTGEVVKKDDALYRYQGGAVDDFDLTTADYSDTGKWVSEVGIPAYADGKAYTIQYVMVKDTDVELIPNIDIVKVVADPVTGLPYAKAGVVGNRYLYVYAGEPEELVLRDQDYTDGTRWADVTGSSNEGQVTYKSDFENYTYKVQSWTTGGGWLRKKTVHTLTTQTFGEKDYYTHTLEAAYPIQISFIQGPAMPSISITTAQDLYLQGTVTTPTDGAITLTSGGDLIFGETAAILGASPTIIAGGSVRANVEGGKPSSGATFAAGLSFQNNQSVLNITSEKDIVVKVVYDSQGNQSSSIVVGQVVSTGGNVVLHAREGIMAYDWSSVVKGNQIELYAMEGGIGSADLPLEVDSDLLGSGGVVAKAYGDIYIEEIAGDLKLAQPQSWGDVQASIYSEQGDVYLHVDSGAILDAFYEEFRPRTEEEAAALDMKQQLTGEEAQKQAEEAIRREEGDQTQLYHNYWEEYRSASPSIVAASEITILSIDAESNEIHFTGPHGLETGDQVFFSVGIDLAKENYGDPDRWAEIVPDYDLETVSGTVSLETDQIVRSADDVLYIYLGENADDVDLGAEDFGDAGRWAELDPDYDLENLAPEARIILETEQVVRTLDDVMYRYQGESVSNPWTNLEKGVDYYAVVEDESTIQLALSRYDAAISETPKVLDIEIEEGGNFNYASVLEYDYTYEDLDPQQDLSERYQRIHETYGDGVYDKNFIYRMSEQEKQERIDARTFSEDALRYPISQSLFNLLYPDEDTPGGQSTGFDETPNVIARNIILSGGPLSQVGRVTGAVSVDMRQGYEALPDAQKEILTIATVEDVVGVSYGLYRYLGATSADLDLKDQDFGDGSLWEKVEPDFNTAIDPSLVQIASGQTVLVQFTSTYGPYRYLGKTGQVNLTKEQYSDTGRWEKVLADYATSDGDVTLGPGHLVENRGEIEFLTLQVWNDIDLTEPESITVMTGQGVALETEGDFRITKIEAGGDVRLKSGGAIVDLDADGTAAAIMTGNLTLVAENTVTGHIGSPDNPLSIDLNGTATLTARAGKDIFIEAAGDLYLDIVDATTDVHLVAQKSIYDGMDSKAANLRAGGAISLYATEGGIGTFDNDVDFDMADSPAWSLGAEAEQGIYLAKTGGELVIGEADIQVTSHAGDVAMSVTDWAGKGDNLVLRGTKSNTLYSANGSVILRGGDEVLVESDASIFAAQGIAIYGDYANTDPGVGGLIDVRIPILHVPVQVYGESDGDEVILTNMTYTEPGPAPRWTIDGREGSDQVTVNLTGTGKSEIQVFDTGTTGEDTLIINGTDADDTFLLRKGFAALLRPDGRDQNNKPKYHPDFERVWYDANINKMLYVNSGEGDDYLALDDNSTTTTIDTGDGNDTVQIGQMFKSIPPGMTEPDDITQTTLGYLTNGVSFETTVYAGDGEDYISVYRNLARLTLYGEAGDDTFVIRAFVVAATSIYAGTGADTIQYAVNAPVDIFGGDGLDKVILIGTEVDDAFVVTDAGVYGAGLTTTYQEIEIIILDAYIGDDQIFVLSTSDAVSTVVMGSFGNDTIHVGGVPAGVNLEDIIVTQEPIAFTVTNTLEPIAGPLRLEGGTGEGTGAQPIADPVNMPGEGEDDPSFGPDELIGGLDEKQSHDTLNVYNQESKTDDKGWLESTSLTGLNMSTGATIEGKDFPGGLVYADMEEMNIDLGSGSDTFNIRGTHSGVTNLNTAEGDETINVGSLAAVMQGGVVDGLAGLINIDTGDGFDSLRVDDTGDTNDNTGTLTGSSLSGLDMGEGLTYANIEILHIGLGKGNDTLSIQGTSVPTTVEGHDGNDTFNVSSDGPANKGTLDNITVELFLYAGAGTRNTLNVSDAGDPDGDTAVRITRDRIEGMAPVTIHYEATGRFGGGVNVWTSKGDDRVTVENTLARDVTSLWLNDGNDVALLKDSDPAVPDGLVIVHGDAGNDTIDASGWNHWVILFGDHGDESYVGGEKSVTTLAEAASHSPESGGSDLLIGTSWNDVLIGGAAGDSLAGGSGDDSLIGDSGRVTYRGGLVYQVENTDFASGGNDYLDGGPGHDVMIGGFGFDTFVGNFSEDIIIGEHGRITFDDSKASSVVRLGQYNLDFISTTMFSLYASPFVSVRQLLGLAVISGIQPGRGAVVTVTGPYAGMGGVAWPQRLSHSGSYLTEDWLRAEGYSAPEEEEYPAPEEYPTPEEYPAPEEGYPGPEDKQEKEPPADEQGVKDEAAPPGDGEGGDGESETKGGSQPDAGEKDNVSEQDKMQLDSGLGGLVACFMGWNVITSERPAGQPILDREAFKELGRKKNSRRFLHWHNGQWKDARPGGSAGTDISQLPHIGFPGFNFEERSFYGADNRK